MLLLTDFLHWYKSIYTSVNMDTMLSLWYYMYKDLAKSSQK